MEESILKKVKYLMQLGPTDEKKSFYVLLESLALDSKDIDRLAKPVEDRIAKERYQAYATGCICVLVALVILLLGALAMMAGIPAQDDAQLGSLWVAGAVLGGLLLLGMWAICEHYKDAELVSDKRLLLYLRFAEEGSMGGMLEELEPQSSVVVRGHEESTEGKPYRFLGPWAAKAAVLVLVLINVMIGAATIAGMMACYEPNQTGVTLTSWSSGFGSSGSVTIPAEKDGKPVTVIGKLAFENRQDVKKIVVPDTVTEIESGAFRGCTNLQEIVLPDTLVSIGAEVFSGCRSLKSFTLPAGVTELRAETFLNCTSLTDVKLHDGLTKLHASVFSGCYSLEEIKLPEGLDELPARLFYQCGALKSIVIPASVKEIGAYAFESCKQLTDVTFLSEMEGGKISAAAFRWCTGLKTFQVPKGVTEMSAEAFYGCSALEEITMPEWLADCKISESTFQNCTSLRSIVIPEGVATISAHAFRGCTSLSSVTVPASLRSIGSSAFRECSSLKTILLPLDCTKQSNSFKDSPTQISYAKNETIYVKTANGAVLLSWDDNASGVVEVASEYQGMPVVGIENEAFKENEGITQVILPDTVRIIGEKAFFRCKNLQEINMPAELQNVGEYAFYGCKQLKKVTFPKGVKSLGEYSFSDCPMLEEVMLPWDCSKYRAFDYWVDVKYFPEEGSEIQGNTSAQIVYDENEFIDDGPVYVVLDNEATLLRWPDAVRADGTLDIAAKYPGVTFTKISDGVFKDRQDIRRVILPDSVRVIGKSAFSGCSQLKEINMPADLQEIGELAFKNCIQLERVTLSAGVQQINRFVFDGCSSLSSVTVPGTLASIDAYAFSNCSSLKTIMLPHGCELDAKAFMDSRTKIEYYNNETVSEKTDGAGQDASVEQRAVYMILDGKATLVNWRGVVSADGEVEIPAEYDGCPVTEIGKGAFSGRADIAKVVLPDTITRIGASAFKGCSLLREISLPASLQVIEQFAFENCGQLASVTLPDGLRKISTYAFYKCKRLSSVTFPAGLQEIERKAFAECPLLTSVSVPIGCSTKSAFDKAVTIEFFTPVGQ